MLSQLSATIYTDCQSARGYFPRVSFMKQLSVRVGFVVEWRWCIFVLRSSGLPVALGHDRQVLAGVRGPSVADGQVALNEPTPLAPVLTIFHECLTSPGNFSSTNMSCKHFFALIYLQFSPRFSSANTNEMVLTPHLGLFRGGGHVCLSLYACCVRVFAYNIMFVSQRRFPFLFLATHHSLKDQFIFYLSLHESKSESYSTPIV